MVGFVYESRGVTVVKTGRPLKGEAPRAIPVSCRLTEAEYRQFQALAFKRRCSITDLLRIAVADLVRAKDAAGDAQRP